MLAAERRQFILATLQQHGKVVAADLSVQLNLSEDTIRRDLRALAEAGLLQRVHGGALPRNPSSVSYSRRQQQSVAAKTAMAAAVAQLFLTGQVILLDSGTTTVAVAEHMPPELEATVVTNSPPVMVALARHPRLTVVAVGGQLFKAALSLVGAAAVEAIHRVRADLCVVSVASLHPDHGLGVLDYEESQVKRAMIESSAEVVVAASRDKLGTASPFVVARLDVVTTLVTERDVPDDVLRPYERLGLTIVKA